MGVPVQVRRRFDHHEDARARRSEVDPDVAQSRSIGQSRTATELHTKEHQVATVDRSARVGAGQDFGFRFGLVSVATWCSSRFLG